MMKLELVMIAITHVNVVLVVPTINVSLVMLTTTYIMECVLPPVQMDTIQTLSLKDVNYVMVLV